MSIVLSFIISGIIMTHQDNLQQKPMKDSYFPQLTAKTLARRKINLPNDIKGTLTLLVLAFDDHGEYKEVSSQADTWTKFWEDNLKQKGVGFYEIPMMSGKYKWVSMWINSGMRGGIPKEKHDNVACFYGDKEKYLKLFGITELRKAHVFLIDKEGKILLYQKGLASESAAEKFKEILR